MTEQAIRTVVIVGGGTAGWMSAAFLARTLAGTNVSITVVESEEIGTVGVGEATIPPIGFFNTVLGLDEADFMRATKATIKLGIEFDGWVSDGHRYLHPFGQFGGSVEGVSFHAFLLRARKNGLPANLWDYSPNAVAAAQGRFAPPPKDRQSPMDLAYAYHFDAGLYARYLRAYAEARGVKRIDAVIDSVECRTDDGGVHRLHLRDGRTVEGDFFVDCSGFRGLLIGDVLKVDYLDWSALLPANRAVAVPDTSAGGLVPYTRATAQRAGWQWRIPLQHRTGNGYVYVSDFISDDEAAASLMGHLQGTPLSEPRFLRFKTGRRRISRAKNVVAIGLSSGFLEPLESTSIHLIQHGLIKLAATFPLGRVDDASAALYNRIMAEEMEQVRDFLIAHYYLNARTGEPLWDYMRHMAIPDSLVEKIELFRRRGLCLYPNQTIFQEANWLALLWGQGIIPDAYDPLADAVPLERLRGNLDYLKRNYAEAASRLPTHEAFLDHYIHSRKTG